MTRFHLGTFRSGAMLFVRLLAGDRMWAMRIR